ncbi:hypothetical protein CYMTET_31974 [Cymbomonas tetramitiformis]|uniref:Uncharacterized protein n=1 Tax=Cymbomonas tetramitiformis TaxID=36881 RepID=A0AAE0KSE4_9CHLO|nr:hypothetical protein CYMTET_31974 [Cymbomonas tetramitiformis]
MRFWGPGQAGRAPEEVREWLAGARLVALLKDNLGDNAYCMRGGSPEAASASSVQKLEGSSFVGGSKKTSPVGCGLPKLRVEANLGFWLDSADAPMQYAKSKEGTQQGKPPGAALLSPAANRVGAANEVSGFRLGDASCFADGMPGTQGELDFIDVSGMPVGKADAVTAEMLKKVEELCALLPMNELGHTQAHGLLLRFGAQQRPGFWFRGVPPEMMRGAAEEHGRWMQEVLRDLLLGGGLPWHSCEFANLPHGMALTKDRTGRSSFQEEVKTLALMDTAWEDTIDVMGLCCAVRQDGYGGGTQGSSATWAVQAGFRWARRGRKDGITALGPAKQPRLLT